MSGRALVPQTVITMPPKRVLTHLIDWLLHVDFPVEIDSHVLMVAMT